MCASDLLDLLHRRVVIEGDGASLVASAHKRAGRMSLDRIDVLRGDEVVRWDALRGVKDVPEGNEAGVVADSELVLLGDQPRQAGGRDGLVCGIVCV